MKKLLYFVAVAILSSARNGYAQESKTQSGNGEVTQAMYMVTGLHCPPCVRTVEGSLKKIKGIDTVKLDFQGKYATVGFKESIISAQEVARVMSNTPHMMGRDMQYGGILVLSVPGVNDEATGKQAAATLRKVEGVRDVTLFPKQQAVGIEFTGKGTVTSKQLTDALKAAGLKGAQYATASGSGTQAMNGGNGAMTDHTGMAMDNGAMAGHGAMGMACGCAPSMQMTSSGAAYAYRAQQRVYSGPSTRSGCGCR